MCVCVWGGGEGEGFFIDRQRSLNSAINDCVHKPRGLRSNEYDERVAAALGERAVHTDLRLIDWTPFHSRTVHHRPAYPSPLVPLRQPTARLIPPHEWANIVDIIKHPAPPSAYLANIWRDASRRATPRHARHSIHPDNYTIYTVKGSFFPTFSADESRLRRLTFINAVYRLSWSNGSRVLAGSKHGTVYASVHTASLFSVA